MELLDGATGDMGEAVVDSSVVVVVEDEGIELSSLEQPARRPDTKTTEVKRMVFIRG